MVGGLLNAEDEGDAALPCQALPCFEMAFIRRASQVIRAVDGWKQANLVNCLAEAGTQAIPILGWLLKHPSALVRTLTCKGLRQALQDEFVLASRSGENDPPHSRAPPQLSR